MLYNELLIHFGELSTKGLNKKRFIQQLAKNIRHSLKAQTLVGTVQTDRDHLYILFDEPTDILPYVDILQRISGIQKITPVLRCELDIKKIEEAALTLAKEQEFETFKVACRRANKAFPLDSFGVMREIGGFLLVSLKAKKVDVHNPDLTLNIEIRDDYAYLSFVNYPGCGGYPLGTNGKVLHLLSGGIDSPVAAYLLLRRGILVEMIHFAAPPYTSERVVDKLTSLMKKLNLYQARIRLHIIPFTDLQLSIYKHAAEPYCITIMRRMMMRISSRLADKLGLPAISTGESIGQVASQTLNSMKVINEVTNTPIIRPLAVFDKLEIIKISKDIDTYDISIEPYEDCCTIFKPKKPRTNPRSKDCEFYEKQWDYESQIASCLENERIIDVEEGVIKSENCSADRS